MTYEYDILKWYLYIYMKGTSMYDIFKTEIVKWYINMKYLYDIYIYDTFKWNICIITQFYDIFKNYLFQKICLYMIH